MNTTAPLTALLAFDEDHDAAQALAQALDIPVLPLLRHTFPDGELKLTLPARLPAGVVMLRTLHPPNERLVELLIAAPSARALGAQRVVLACPYLAYMRQDIAFHPGEAVSQRHIAGLLARHFDAIVTVDPHLHRITRLDEVMPGCQAVALSAAATLGAWVAQQVGRPLLLGPDGESAQWVSQAAQACQPVADHGWCSKVRHGDREVVVELPTNVDCRGRAVVLIDDMASTGRTLAAATRLALAAGALSVDVAVTHALFVGDALAQLQVAGVRHVWSTDCVPHASNRVSVTDLLAQALRQL
jgi:ribose-phosphate pyrophosphokinase